jgi:hypothetical protein
MQLTHGGASGLPASIQTAGATVYRSPIRSDVDAAVDAAAIVLATPFSTPFIGAPVEHVKILVIVQPRRVDLRGIEMQMPADSPRTESHPTDDEAIPTRHARRD